VRLLELTPQQAALPGPVQTGFFEASPGPIDQWSPPEAKVDFFGALFAARRDVYAIRWENARTGRAGWLPAVRGGWRTGVRHADQDYLPLTREVVRAHLSGEMHIGLYPLLDGDPCSWLAAETARRLGTALLREAMALRGHRDLASYDRLFPAQDVLPSGGVGNLIAAPMHGKARGAG
jgi:hypothetical protein